MAGLSIGSWIVCDIGISIARREALVDILYTL